MNDDRALQDAPPARGLLGPAPPGPFEHRRVLPCAALSDRVSHFWWVRWDLAQPFTAETLSHPSAHLVFESPGAHAELAGPPSRRFTRQLSGRGGVFGVKFRPGMFQALAGVSMATLADARLPIAQVLASAPPAACFSTALPDAVAAAQAWLLGLCPTPTTDECHWRDLVDQVETDRTVQRVEQMATLAGCSVRTLERRLRWQVGLGPKFIIRRYRLMEAAERLRAWPAPGIAELAAELGYFDQSHFVRDFKAVVGRAPSAFASAAAQRVPSRA